MNSPLRVIISSINSAVELRLFAEYGGVFATAATPPPTVIFRDAAEVESFQSSLKVSRAAIGDHEITLQAEAMDALIRAASEMNDRGGQITARAEDSGGRSYEDTVRLWTRNVTRGLDHWEAEGRISPERAGAIRALAPVEQIPIILELEERERLYFGTFLNRSILYSVAAPGASQHLALLAFDVAEYKDEAVEQTLNQYGWFRTVPNDLPHFTYLGLREEDLPELGLKQVSYDYDDRSYSFWVPDLDTLR
ncbi:MAG TPA: hypothetical protein VNI02_17875 [Blastocatellia bacterium]|jgi:hypothetical protein|nr:hypothetical protein [Blastocatellia bacterium]